MRPDQSGIRVLFLRTDPANFDPRILKETTSLHTAGYDVRVYGWDRGSEHAGEERVGGVLYRRCAVRAPYGSNALAFYLPLYWYRALGEIRRMRPRIIHACDFDTLIPALLGKCLFGSKVVYDIFDHFADKLTSIPRALRVVLRHIDSFLTRWVDLLVVTDERRLSLLRGSRSGPVVIIMNVPPAGVVSGRDAAPRGSVRVCYAGVIHEHRGLRLIATAIRDIDGIETVFAGWIPRPVDREFLLGQDKISYIGKLPYAETMRLLGNCDILLGLYDPSVPINRFASSNKVYEAMSVGIPVVSNQETSMAEIISEISCGLLVPYGDPASLTAAILRLRDDAALRREMGERGRRAYRERYNWGVMENRLLECYARLTADLTRNG